MPNESGTNEPAVLPRVAVVAIHGVGHHESGSSASAVADLLLGVNDGQGPLYERFSTQRLQIPLRPPSSPAHVKRNLGTRIRTVFQERRGTFEEHYQLSSWFGPKKKASPLLSSIAQWFMDSLLEQYQGDPVHNSAQTFRIETVRAGRGALPAKKVDLYDMCWSDLARPSNSFLRFFFSFYQLLIHLPSLGRIAIDHAALEYMGSPSWFLLQRVYTYATRILTLVIVNLLTLLPIAAFSPVVLLLGNDLRADFVAGAIQLAMLFGLVVFLNPLSAPSLNKSWWSLLLPGAAISIAFSVLLFRLYPGAAPAVLTFEWWLLGVVVVLIVFQKYDEVRAGGREVGIGLTFATVFAFALCVFALRQQPLEQCLKTAAFWLVQYIFFALRLSWILFMGLVLLAFLLEGICRLPASDGDRRARARAALRTGRFTLAVSSVLLLLLTVFLWSGAYHFVAGRVDLFRDILPALAPGLESGPAQPFVLNVKEMQQLPIRTGSDPCQPGPAPAFTTYRFLEGLLFQSAPLGFPAVLGLISGGFLILVLMVLPSVYREIQAPRRSHNGPSRRLGYWLSGGLDSFRVMIWCFWLAAFGTPTLYLLAAFLNHARHGGSGRFIGDLYSSWGMCLTGQLLTSAGATIAGSAVVIFGLVLKYGSSALDAVLDVDSYLRTSPPAAAPRARIVDRYVALINFLCSHRGPDGQPYERIVIVAHSLGSNITADLLYYLNGSGFAPGIPIHFFTMGSPLRQLLNRFFPHLYYYIRPVPDGSGGVGVPVPATINPLIAPPGRGTIPQNAPPDPGCLGLAEWVNFYRSGDYVGRTLWVDQHLSRTGGADNSGAYPAQLLVFTDNPGSRSEACVGLGAHTHYWDRSAPDVGEMLNVMI